MNEEQDVTELYKEIIARGCCNRCALRYLGYCRTLVSFEEPAAALIAFGVLSPLEGLQLEPAAKKQKPSPCSVCLGLLDDAMLEEMLSHDALTRCLEYNHKSFIPYITFPISSLLRDHSMKLHLQQKFPKKFNVENVIKVNVGWRNAIEQKLARKLEKRFSANKANLSIHFHMDYLLEEEEVRSVSHLAKDPRSWHNPGRSLIRDVLGSLSVVELSRLISVPPKIPFYAVTLKDVTYSAQPVHLIGQYCKYSRELAQCHNPNHPVPNLSDMITKAVTDVVPSVKEVIFHVHSYDETQVRILGCGRTFHLELVDPKLEEVSQKDCKKIEKLANKNRDIKVMNLKSLHRKEVQNAMDFGIVSARSCKLLCIVTEYKNLDHCINAINMYQTITVHQKTPIRVLHQRPYWDRKKQIYSIKAKKLRDNLIEVDMCGQSGLYFIEFVHGDLGRTVPSLCDIMRAKVDVVAMDITDFQGTMSPASMEEDVVI